VIQKGTGRGFDLDREFRNSCFKSLQLK